MKRFFLAAAALLIGACSSGPDSKTVESLVKAQLDGAIAPLIALAQSGAGEGEPPPTVNLSVTAGKVTANDDKSHSAALTVVVAKDQENSESLSGSATLAQADGKQWQLVGDSMAALEADTVAAAAKVLGVPTKGIVEALVESTIREQLAPILAMVQSFSEEGTEVPEVELVVEVTELKGNGDGSYDAATTVTVTFMGETETNAGVLIIGKGPDDNWEIIGDR